MKLFLFLTVFFLFISCSQPDALDSFHVATDFASRGFDGFLSDYTEAVKRLDPFYAPYFHVEEYLEKFGDYPAPSYFERHRKVYTLASEKMNSVIPGLLPQKNLQAFLLLKEDVANNLHNLDFPFVYLEFNQMNNRVLDFINEANPTLTNFPFDSVRHYEAFIKKAQGFPTYVENQIEVLKKGIEKKIVLNCVAASRTPETYREALETNIEKNPFWKPISILPAQFSESQKRHLKEEFKVMIEKQILPSLRHFDAFYKNEYLKNCRSTDGLSELPNGKAWYQQAIKNGTGLDWDAQKIHEIGLSEVARIEKDLVQIKNELKFKGDLKSFLAKLLSDPKNFFSSAAEMKKTFEETKAKVAAVIPRYFKLVPKSDYHLVETTNPEDAAGSYSSPTENKPEGRFIMNTKNLRAIPKYQVTTLSLHEAIPGHHFQLALQFEKKNEITEFQRKIFFSNAFVEGWALYAESLGNEMELFKDPLQRLGNRDCEMLRAVRLVVDTGIHAFGWNHQKVVDYMKAHLAMDAKDIENEANRYSAMPGQALGYKIGEIKIKELRKMALEKLKYKFDIKEFHEVVIGSGTVSLGVLEDRVKKWLKVKKEASLKEFGI